MKALFIFRGRQCFRILKDVGWGNLILLSPILFVVVLGILQHLSTTDNFLASGVVLFLLGGLHFNRTDRFFLEQFVRNIRILFLLEYLLICLPWIVTDSYFSKWWDIGILLVGVLIISCIKPSYKKQGKQLVYWNFSWIPLEIFEWRCGFRRSLVGFLLGYLAGVLLAQYTVVIPLVVFGLGVGVSSFFQDFENKDLLLAVNQKQQLLRIKVRKSLLLFHLLLLPLYMLFLFFHYSYTWVLIIVIGITSMLIVFAICVKYKNYRFGYSRLYSTLPLAIFVSCLVLPFLWPIPIIMLIRFWRDAQQNLMKHYA